MTIKILAFIVIFVLGELLVNATFFKYLKAYFNAKEEELEEENHTHKLFLGFHISVFKGLMERFVLFLCLLFGLSQILVVFGALKIGTRIDKNNQIKNDYFLIGSFCSILLGVLYYQLFTSLVSMIGNYCKL